MLLNTLACSPSKGEPCSGQHRNIDLFLMLTDFFLKMLNKCLLS